MFKEALPSLHSIVLQLILPLSSFVFGIYVSTRTQSNARGISLCFSIPALIQVKVLWPRRHNNDFSVLNFF